MDNIMKILQGSPGSSKSEYINDQICSENWPRYAMICGTEQYTQEVIAASLPHIRHLSAEALCFRRAMDLVISKAPFIIIDIKDSTTESWAPYVLLAKSHNYAFEIIHFDENV